ncbi:tripartite tricarboxylate transporter TctB family protein [uncultured Pseudokineococcus sp.]|uniref:tripartite tricarboxylate transporter TctB family protein n=1 Tax=uncultured Pseudokineococcus sp. TaxID=1642928 RepID=UPI002620641B|nr:tripartite tricarboxylate transporter TctB family protein [uncultured Pseudokineococcus sp.]
MSTPAGTDRPGRPVGGEADDADGGPNRRAPLAAPEPSRGSPAMALVVTAFALYLTYGLVVMDANTSSEGGPGPRFFPALVLVLAWAVTAGLWVDVVRQRRAARRERDTGSVGGAPEPAPARSATDDAGAGTAGLAPEGAGTVPGGAGDDRPTAPTDWRSVALVAATFAVFIAVLVPLGWLLAGTWLFWGTAQALGSRRRLFDLGVALAVASVVQLAFRAGLGLNLPAGVLGL